MAISSVTGWIDKDNFRWFYKNGIPEGRYPMPPDKGQDYKESTMKTVLYCILHREGEDLMKYSANDFIEIGIMMGNQLKEAPNGN